MEEREKIEHEVIKYMLKMNIMNNPMLSNEQKDRAIHNIDVAAQKADWIMEIIHSCGYIQ